mgnify:CR=1 FL=1
MGLDPYQGNTGLGFDSPQRGPEFEHSQKTLRYPVNNPQVSPLVTSSKVVGLGGLLRSNAQIQKDKSENEKINEGVLSKEQLINLLNEFKKEFIEIINLYPSDEKVFKNKIEKKILEKLSSNTAKIAGLEHIMSKQKKKIEDLKNCVRTSSPCPSRGRQGVGYRIAFKAVPRRSGADAPVDQDRRLRRVTREDDREGPWFVRFLRDGIQARHVVKVLMRRGEPDFRHYDHSL